MASGPPLASVKPPGKQPHSHMSLILGSMTLLVFVAVAFALAPEMTGVVIVLFVIIALQYFLWGRWLGDLIRKEEADAMEDDTR